MANTVVWRIIDGDLPFLYDFPTQYEIEYTSDVLWQISDGTLPYKKAFPHRHGFSDVPDSMWAIRDGTLPYKKTFPQMYPIEPIPVQHADPVIQGDYICAFDMHNPQDKFSDNGLCVLMPTKCELAEELNSLLEITLEHPIDAEGRWSRLLELNIIKAKEQLYRIYSKQTKLNSDGSKVRTVKARHIFYDLNDRLLVDVRPENKNGYDFIDWVMTHTYDDDPEHYYPQFTFTYASDIMNTATSYFIGASVTASMLGADNCFINRLGGEIYRDNFYFSINEHKEGSQQNAFDIRYGVDMIEVEENIDYSDLVTCLIVSDNFAHSKTITHGNTPRIAHHISRSVTFSYESEEASAAFDHDADAYFDLYKYPKINYKVKFANLKNADLYKDFIGLAECNVGDTGYIYCEELGISTLQKVIKKTTDLLTGDVVSIELGNMQSSLTRQDKYSTMVYDNSSAAKEAKAAQEEARKAIAQSIDIWADTLRLNWGELRPFKWSELKAERP